jgi:hypothetical protein
MTALVSSPARGWVGAHRVFMIVVAFALAAAATLAIVLLTSSPSTSSTTTNPPAQEEQLTDTQKACQAARVVGC